MTLPIARAFAWLRWRMFINSLERTGSRDILERFSLAADQIRPIMAAVVMIPSGLALAGLGATAGYAIAQNAGTSLAAALPRYLLIAFPAFSVAGPLLLPGAGRVNPTRMLLLPIGRGALYAAHVAASLGDIWVALLLPLVVSLPIGLGAGGAWLASFAAAAAGALLTGLVLAVTSTTTTAVHLAVRDRRRGERLALVVILLVPLMAMLPALVGDLVAPAIQHADVPALTPALRRVLLRAAWWYPSELYISSVNAAVSHRFGQSAAALAALAAEAVAAAAIGMRLFGRMLDSPGSSGAARGGRMSGIWQVTLPGVSPGASAVALAHVRLAARTPRGRAILLSPVALTLIAAVILKSVPTLDIAGRSVDGALVVAAVGTFVCLLATLPVSMNQFGVDSGGLTRVLLSPLDDRDHLLGKAVGNGLIAAIPIGLFAIASWAMSAAARRPVTWLMLALSMLCVHLMVSPVAAMLSAAFPRKADLDSIGRHGNPHGLATLLGLMSWLLAGVATLSAAVAAMYFLRSPVARVAAAVVWCGVSAAVGRALFVPARRLFSARRDNLAML